MSKIKSLYLIFLSLSILCMGCGKDSPAPAKPIALTAIEVESEQIKVKVGESTIIKYNLIPANVTEQTVTITSLDPTIAEVSGIGVKAIKIGKTKIVISNAEKTISASIDIEVLPIDAEGLVLNKKSIELFIGGRDTVTAVVNPPTTSDKTVLWESESPEIASVSKDGHVLALKDGETRIFVSVNNKAISDTVNVLVRPIAIAEIKLNKVSFSLKVDEEERLIATINPPNSTNSVLKWSSGNTAIATVDQTGLVKAKGVGVAIIKVSSPDGKITAQAEINVLPIRVSSIALDQQDLVLAIGSTMKVNATVLPANATDKTINWQTSNAAIFTVNQGSIIALKKGIANLTVTAGNGEVVSSISIEVKDDYELISGSLSFSMSSIPGRTMIGMTPRIRNGSNKTINIQKVECYVEGVLSATDLEKFVATIEGKSNMVDIVTFTQTLYSPIVNNFPPNWHAKVYFTLNNANYSLTIMKSGSSVQSLSGVSIGINPSWDGESKIDF